MWCHSFILRFGSKTLWVCSAISLWIFKNFNRTIGQTLTESSKSISDVSTGRLNWVGKLSFTRKMHVLTVSKRYQAEEIFFGRYGEVIVLLKVLKESFIDLEEFVEVQDPASWACLITPFSNSNCIVSETNHFYVFYIYIYVYFHKEILSETIAQFVVSRHALSFQKFVVNLSSIRRRYCMWRLASDCFRIQRYIHSSSCSTVVNLLYFM